MGERKGQNHYYPPDFDPQIHGSLNGYHGVHALRERAKHLDKGVMIIRFELPYHIWCSGCKKHISKGVRYNAHKRRVGYYFSTPIYRFSMRCHLCPNIIEMETDPKNRDYVIVRGAKKKIREWDDDPTDGAVRVDDTEIAEKLHEDAFFREERTKEAEDMVQTLAKPRLEAIEEMNFVMKDDFSASQLLRSRVREERNAKQRKLEEARRIGLGNIELEDLTESDHRHAESIVFRDGQSPRAPVSLSAISGRIANQSIFSQNSGKQVLQRNSRPRVVTAELPVIAEKRPVLQITETVLSSPSTTIRSSDTYSSEHSSRLVDRKHSPEPIAPALDSHSVRARKRSFLDQASEGTSSSISLQDSRLSGLSSICSSYGSSNSDTSDDEQEEEHQD